MGLPFVSGASSPVCDLPLSRLTLRKRTGNSLSRLLEVQPIKQYQCLSLFYRFSFIRESFLHSFHSRVSNFLVVSLFSSWLHEVYAVLN